MLKTMTSIEFHKEKKTLILNIREYYINDNQS